MPLVEDVNDFPQIRSQKCNMEHRGARKDIGHTGECLGSIEDSVRIKKAPPVAVGERGEQV